MHHYQSKTFIKKMEVSYFSHYSGPSSCIHGLLPRGCGVFGGSGIGGLLRTWIARMTNYWLLSVAPCLTGLGLGESPLVTLSLCSLALSFALSVFPLSFFLFSYSALSVLFSLPYVFMHKAVFLNIYPYYLSKKKKKGPYLSEVPHHKKNK